MVWGGAFAVAKRRRPADGWLLGLGVACLLASRPFEGALACVVPAGMLAIRWLTARAPGERARLWREGLAPAALMVSAAFSALALYNKAVTGDALRLPYSVYELRHSGAPLFVWQKGNVPPEAAFSAPSLAAFHERFVLPMSRLSPFDGSVWLLRLRDAVVSNLGWTLSMLALLGAALGLGRRAAPVWCRLAALSIGVCSLGFLVSIWFEVHYYLPMLPPLVLLAVRALRQMRDAFGRGRVGIGWIAALAVLVVSLGLARNGQFERSPDYYNRVFPRQKVVDALAGYPGRFLILVRPEEPFDLHRSYVANAADIDHAKIVWAWDRGEVENLRLLDYYPDREVVLMRVSARAMAFTPYPRPASP